jgi:hypothetical protein
MPGPCNFWCSFSPKPPHRRNGRTLYLCPSLGCQNLGFSKNSKFGVGRSAVPPLPVLAEDQTAVYFIFFRRLVCCWTDRISAYLDFKIRI